jgi:hypothetical protein
MGKSALKWLVIGAGPAGIAAVGKLLDHRIDAKNIGWLDPEFAVGDFGNKWQNVSSNTKVGLFIEFFKGCKSFQYDKRPHHFSIDSISPHEHCFLKDAAVPLQWITDHLMKLVRSTRGEALALNLKEGCWEIKTRERSITAENVILCVGSDPKNLPHSHPPSIPLDEALNPEKLKSKIKPTDTVGVFGSSHSAVLVLANLLQLPLKHVHNFYRSPQHYALDLGKWILFDNTGLKGLAADWARVNLEGNSPKNLTRWSITNPSYEEALEVCDHVIYAVGFERRKLPVLEQFPSTTYHETTGIIAPRLFGLGIAYPQAQLDPLGNKEYRVGLWKFMDYLTSIFPIWLKLAKS